MNTGKDQERTHQQNQEPTADQSNFKNTTDEELDQKIKNEQDTERLRSEKQSVIDGQNGKNSE